MLENIQCKIKQVKEMINVMERKSIEIITASAELEYRYKKAVSANDVTYQTASELLTLEKKVDELLKNSLITNEYAQ
jgi:hypothetical protein